MRSLNLGGNNQNEKLFRRGNAISAQLSIKGNNQFPKPPIKIGITKKKIIIKPWAVIVTLYLFSLIIFLPPYRNSERIINLINVPTNPDHIPKIKYKVPISLWFVLHPHRDREIFNINIFILSYNQSKQFLIVRNRN